jgi:metal-responsive CopG/Arc/MetJ family transcriptional regulator
MKQESKPMTRIQLELPEERLHELEQLMEQTGTNTKKDLLNDALTLFEWAVKERMTGRTIASVDEQQQRYKEVVMPSLERAVKAACSSAAR